VSAATPAKSDTDITPSSPAADTSPAAPKLEASLPDPVIAPVEAPKAASSPAPAAEIKATAAELGASPRANTATVLSAAAKPSRSNRFGLLAATVAIAAGLGVAGGAWGAYKFPQARSIAAKAATSAPVSDKTIALQNTVARMQTELAALRTSVDAGNRATNNQFAKLTERFDRVDRSQTERTAKFAKAVETLERLEKRADAAPAPAPARESTSSVAAPTPASAQQPQPVSATPAPPPAQQHQQPQVQPPQQAILEGWVVRNVYRGTAIVQSRRFGTIDVEPGDTLPGAGRIENIKKQDGSWVVVTSRGLIVSMR
jgi:hypothetical protein